MVHGFSLRKILEEYIKDLLPMYGRFNKSSKRV